MPAIVASLSITVLEGVCVVVFFDTFMERRRTKHKYIEYVLAVLLLTIANFSVGFFLHDLNSVTGEITKVSIFIVTYTIFGITCYKRSFPTAAVLAPIMYFLIFITDYIGLSITDFVSGDTNTFFETSNDSSRIVLGIVIKLGLFLFVMLIRITCIKLSLGKYRNRQISTSPRWTLFLLMPTLSIASIIALVNVAEPENHTSPVLLIISTGWLVMTVTVFILLQIFDEKEQELREAQIMDEHTETTMQGLETVSQVNEDYHDYLHHLALVENWLAEGKYEQAYDYLRSTSYSDIVTMPRIFTNNDVVDAIVNQKYWTAKRKSMCIVPFMSDLSNLPIADHDLVSILANLLDNAIEACEELSDGRIIQLKMIRENDELIISVRNPVANDIRIVDDTIETSKPNKRRHGHGMRSIQRSLDRYDALYAFECKDKHFQYSAIVPLPTEKLA